MTPGLSKDINFGVIHNSYTCISSFFFFFFLVVVVVVFFFFFFFFNVYYYSETEWTVCH